MTVSWIGKDGLFYQGRQTGKTLQVLSNIMGKAELTDDQTSKILQGYPYLIDSSGSIKIIKKEDFYKDLGDDCQTG